MYNLVREVSHVHCNFFNRSRLCRPNSKFRNNGRHPRHINLSVILPIVGYNKMLMVKNADDF